MAKSKKSNQNKKIMPENNLNQSILYLKYKKAKTTIQVVIFCALKLILFVISILLGFWGLQENWHKEILISTSPFHIITTSSFMIALSVATTVLLLFDYAAIQKDILSKINLCVNLYNDEKWEDDQYTSKVKKNALDTLNEEDQIIVNLLRNLKLSLLKKGKKKESEQVFSYNRLKHRDLIRKWILYNGVALLIVIASLSIFVFGNSLPVTLVWVGLFGVGLFLFDIASSQFITHREGVKLFSPQHQQYISLSNSLNPREKMAYIKKVFAMEYDRLSNHKRLFVVLEYITNYFGIFLIVLALGDGGTMEYELQNWLRSPFPINNLNGKLGIILIFVSVLLFLIDTFSLLFGGTKSQKLNILMSLSYNQKNYKRYEKEFNSIVNEIKKHKWGPYGFHKRLNIAEATYEYNIEILYENLDLKKVPRYIMKDYTYYKAHTLYGNRQRFHFLGWMYFLLSFCYFVWEKQNIWNFPLSLFISIIALILSIFCVRFVIIRKHPKWMEFEKRIKKETALSYRLIQR